MTFHESVANSRNLKVLVAFDLEMSLAIITKTFKTPLTVENSLQLVLVQREFQPLRVLEVHVKLQKYFEVF